MKGASKVIMGATLVMVVTLAIVLGLILVLLVDLYCTLLLRRRRRLQVNSSNGVNVTPAATSTTAVVPTSSSSTHPPHAQIHPDTPLGALEAPRSLFYPTTRSQLHHFLHPKPKTSPSPNSSSPHQNGEIQIQINATNEEPEPEPPVVNISNPVFNETPFETPDSSPSRLEQGHACSSGCSVTSPLTTMKKLPDEASSVSLRNSRSLATLVSDSVSNNNGLSSPSSFSGSLCNSPSWSI